MTNVNVKCYSLKEVYLDIYADDHGTKVTRGTLTSIQRCDYHVKPLVQELPLAILAINNYTF